MRLPLWALAVVAGAAALLAACGDDSSSRTARVVQAIPWTGEEHLFYQLTQKGVNGNAECELQTLPPTGATPSLTLVRLCHQDQHRDDATATVDAKTLHHFKLLP